MKILVLSEQHGYQYILSRSNQEEIELIKQNLIDKGFIIRKPEYRAQHFVLVKDIIAFGNSEEISEYQCRRFIVADKATLSPGSRYKCFLPFSSERPFEIHYDARSAWNSALMYLAYPSLTILYRIPLEKEEELIYPVIEPTIQEEEPKEEKKNPYWR